MRSIAGAEITAERPTKMRYWITGLMFVTVVINYLDRSNLSIAAPALSKELGIDSIHMGYVFSAFAWTYTVVQIPGGMLADRINPRMLYPTMMLLWSVATLCLGLASGFVTLLVLRMCIGLFEAPSYPMNNRIATTWFQERERATCIGIYTSAQWVGLAFLAPVLSWLLTHHGWASIFVVTGLIGVAWAGVWFLFYRDPVDFRGVNNAEIAHIASGGGLPDLTRRIAARNAAAPGFSWRDLGLVLSRRKLWGIYLGQFGLGSTQIFFLTWFPTYLVHYRHMGFMQAGLVASIPFLAAFVGVLCSVSVRRHLAVLEWVVVR